MRQVDFDIIRSLNTYDVCLQMSEETRKHRMSDLTKLISAILCKYPNYKYYQGYHDVVSVFLLTLESNLAFYCLE